MENIHNSSKYLILWSIPLAGLYLISLHNYLLFHSLVEIFSIVIACGVFMIAWNARQIMENDYFKFLGTAYLFIAIVDMLHTLAYSGMGVFKESSANVPTQLWIAARYLESASLLAAPLFIKRKINLDILFAVFTAITLLLILSIFYLKVFPTCYVQGSGLTSFKKVSEYLISLAILAATLILFRYREKFDPDIFDMILLSLIFTIFAELAFTFYVSVYGISNLIGHFFKLFSFYLIYKAIIQNGLRKPYSLLFRNLKISEEKLGKAYLELDAILKSVADGLIVTDNDNRVILMNHAAEDIFNLPFKKACGQPIDSVIKENNLRERVRETLAQKKTGQNFDFELHSADEKHPRIMRARTAVIHDNEGTEKGIVTTISDVSHEREVDRMKTEFLSIAAHELRSPLATIMGFSEMLLHDPEISDDDKKQFLSSINKQATELEKIISDLLDISRIESGKAYSLNKTSCNLNHCINFVISNYKASIKNHVFDVNLPEEEIIANADPDKIIQVFSNLINNAVKYSPGGGSIKISGCIEENSARFSVDDEGIGMTREELEKVFDKFYRANNVKSDVKGTGLGMSIVKSIIEAHNGQIWINSEWGKGTKVEFHIPLE